MADFPIDEAQIVALFLETMFYGIYLVSFGMCLHALLPRGRIKSGQHSLLVVTLLLFVFATLDEALIVRHVLEAFIWYKGNGGARAEFADISNWVNGMKTVSYTAQTGLGDGILIYRCFVIYGHNWAIAMGLCLLYISGLVCATIVCYIEFTMHQSALLNATRLTPFMIAALCLTLFLNIIATSLIFHKIRSIQRQSARLFVDIKGGGGALPHAVRIVTESGAMYTISVAVLLVVSCTGSSAQYGVSDCIVQVIGIAFNLIIIRVGRGQTTEFMVAKHDMSGHVVDSQNRGNSSASGEAIPLHLAKGGSTITNITFLDDDPMRLADVMYEPVSMYSDAEVQFTVRHICAEQHAMALRSVIISTVLEDMQVRTERYTGQRSSANVVKQKWHSLYLFSSMIQYIILAQSKTSLHLEELTKSAAPEYFPTTSRDRITASLITL